MSSEYFRQKFVNQQWNPTRSWRGFAFETTSYFEDWLEVVGVNDFDGLINLMIAEQLKLFIPAEIPEHFINDRAKFIVPGTLTEKLNENKSIRSNAKRSSIMGDTKHRPTDK